MGGKKKTKSVDYDTLLCIITHYCCYSQFFICTADTPWLNGKHTVFGKVTNGMDIVRKVEYMGTELGKPKQEIKIVDCGEL